MANGYDILKGGYDYPNWPRDVNGNPTRPLDDGGKPIKYGRGPTGELYAIYDTYASPLEGGVPFITIPVLVQ